MNSLFSVLAETIKCWPAIAAGVAILSAPLSSTAETIFVERLDGSLVKLIIDRPEGESSIPIVLFIDGSSCVSVERERFQQRDYVGYTGGGAVVNMKVRARLTSCSLTLIDVS